ncbi:hypothetical protein B9Z55_008985 [Caenorhabditis nigoni]|uniref:Uncharacterized protein n=1 Tax=Caenorhabditis nigoni TaxID=1611254 RepID=A0A2G5UQA7_9PELO|nr:hypothetical protein B9Z55_008985 [Caenorhabditis nigoni]
MTTGIEEQNSGWFAYRDALNGHETVQRFHYGCDRGYQKRKGTRDANFVPLGKVLRDFTERFIEPLHELHIFQ